KKLSAAPYRLTIAVPNWGQMEQSIDIGPSFADEKNRVEMEFRFHPDYQTEETDVVSLKQLSVSGKAKNEYREALKKLEKKETDKAISHLERAVELAPHYAEAWNHLGTISFVSGEYAKAEKYFREALKYDPNSFSPIVNLGAALYALGRIEESLIFNQKAVSLNPRDPLANSQLGLSYLALKKYPEAEDHLLKCKSLDPAHFSHPQVTLAELYRQIQDIEGMLRELKEFIFYHPDDGKVPALRRILAEVKNTPLPIEADPKK
ncbi:MAG: tetratricopeptide repeat protein, partial [Acidobacteriota bacterium]